MFITVRFDEKHNASKSKGKVYIAGYERGQQDNISARAKNEQKSFLTYPRKLDLTTFKVQIVSDTEFHCSAPNYGQTGIFKNGIFTVIEGENIISRCRCTPTAQIDGVLSFSSGFSSGLPKITFRNAIFDKYLRDHSIFKMDARPSDGIYPIHDGEKIFSDGVVKKCNGTSYKVEHSTWVVLCSKTVDDSSHFKTCGACYRYSSRLISAKNPMELALPVINLSKL